MKEYEKWSLFSCDMQLKKWPCQFVRSSVRSSVTIFRNQLKSSYCSSRLVKEGTVEVSWLKDGCCGIRDKIGKRKKSVLRVKASIEGRLCISTTVKVEKKKNGPSPPLQAPSALPFIIKSFRQVVLNWN